MSDIEQELRDGCAYHPDTGYVDDDATDTTMARAADELARLRAELEAARGQAIAECLKIAEDYEHTEDWEAAKLICARIRAYAQAIS